MSGLGSFSSTSTAAASSFSTPSAAEPCETVAVLAAQGEGRRTDPSEQHPSRATAAGLLGCVPSLTGGSGVAAQADGWQAFEDRLYEDPANLSVHGQLLGHPSDGRHYAAETLQDPARVVVGARIVPGS